MRKKVLALVVLLALVLVGWFYLYRYDKEKLIGDLYSQIGGKQWTGQGGQANTLKEALARIEGLNRIQARDKLTAWLRTFPSY